MAKKSDRIGNRRHTQGIESRRRILEVAFEIAAERGYDGTTLSQITKRVGVPPSSVYWQFENKDELLAEVVEVYYREWLDEQKEWNDDTGTESIEGAVEQHMARLARGLASEPRFQRLGLILSLEQRVVELSARRRFRAVRSDFRDALTYWWEQRLPGSLGERRPSVARNIAITLIALSDGLLIATQVDDGIDLEGPLSLVSIGLIHALRSVSSPIDDDAPRTTGQIPDTF